MLGWQFVKLCRQLKAVRINNVAITSQEVAIAVHMFHIQGDSVNERIFHLADLDAKANRQLR